jgi:hypothetical protein
MLIAGRRALGRAQLGLSLWEEVLVRGYVSPVVHVIVRDYAEDIFRSTITYHYAAAKNNDTIILSYIIILTNTIHYGQS